MNVLITGARSGIGKDVAIDLVDRGHFVYLTTHTIEQANSFRREFQHERLCVFPLDITKEEDISKVESLDIDVLICHAGIGQGGSLLDLPISQIRNNFEVNFFGTFTLVRSLLPKLVYRDGAKVIVTSSIAGLIPIPFLGSYCATKAAISVFLKALRLELMMIDARVQVCLIEPGIYHTGFNDVMLDNKEPYFENSPYFKRQHQMISVWEKRFFSFFGKHRTNSIVACFRKAVEKKKIKKVYRAPISSRIFLKLYLLFFG